MYRQMLIKLPNDHDQNKNGVGGHFQVAVITLSKSLHLQGEKEKNQRFSTTYDNF